MYVINYMSTRSWHNAFVISCIPVAFLSRNNGLRLSCVVRCRQHQQGEDVLEYIYLCDLEMGCIPTHLSRVYFKQTRVCESPPPRHSPAVGAGSEPVKCLEILISLGMMKY
jgi:hypothetical protein